MIGQARELKKGNLFRAELEDHWSTCMQVKVGKATTRVKLSDKRWVHIDSKTYLQIKEGK